MISNYVVLINPLTSSIKHLVWVIYYYEKGKTKGRGREVFFLLSKQKRRGGGGKKFTFNSCIGL